MAAVGWVPPCLLSRVLDEERANRPGSRTARNLNAGRVVSTRDAKKAGPRHPFDPARGSSPDRELRRERAPIGIPPGIRNFTSRMRKSERRRADAPNARPYESAPVTCRNTEGLVGPTGPWGYIPAAFRGRVRPNGGERASRVVTTRFEPARAAGRIAMQRDRSVDRSVDRSATRGRPHRGRGENRAPAV